MKTICLIVFLSACPVIFAQQADCPETGPTIKLSYGTDGAANKADCFMYFVPLISLTDVDSVSSDKNTQKAKIISHRKTIHGNTFKAVCEFSFSGKGYHQNNYDPVDMIEEFSKGKKGKPLKNMLAFIRVEGSGYGSVEVTGTIENGRETVKLVKVNFNERGTKSPVSIGLFSVKKSDGKYDYDKRYDKMVVRVNTLSFKEYRDDFPKMEVLVDSISKPNQKEGFWSKLKGAVANFFIPPVKVDSDGNSAMLDFGYALYKKQNEFTFPKAKNLIEIPKQITSSDPAVTVDSRS